MLNILYKFVTPWRKSNRAQILINRIIGRIANYLYPAYCLLTRPSKNSKYFESKYEPKVIVSLTSFPARISKAHLCLESILRQSHKADKVILWLAKSQFADMDSLPKNIKKLNKYGLEIMFCEDIRSYKKIFFTAQLFTKDIIITADDDVLYPENWIEELIDTYKENRNCVCCYRAHEIGIDKDGKITPYKKWKPLADGIKGPSYYLLPTGVGGVLYPPLFFKNVDFNYEVIKKLCPTADDLWLKAISLKNEYRVVKVKKSSKEWFTIISSQKEALESINVGENQNDIAMKNLIEYYQITLTD